MNRLSSQEIQGGDTIGGQILDGLRTAVANDCEVVAVIASTNYRSELRFEEREDYAWIFERFELGQIDGAVFREPDRVARKQAVAHVFYDKTRELGIDLYLASFGRAIDWSSDGDPFQISLLGALSEAEVKKTAERTYNARLRRWVQEGRGWPGCGRFGFRRNPDSKYLEVDPEQWPAIEFIHNEYGRLSNGKKNGYAAIVDGLAEMGFDLSAEKVRKILLDPIYVDGHFAVAVEGELVACEPIVLERPIPRQVFQRNQELLACQKGTYSKVPVGTNALNGIVVEHGACRETIDPRTGNPPRLRVNNSRAGDPSYWHRGKHPKSCHGYRVEQRQLESAVVRELLKLAEDPDVQAAWAVAAAEAGQSEHEQSNGTTGDGNSAESLQMSLEAQRLQLVGRVANLKAEHERQIQQLADFAGEGQKITATHRAVAEKIEAELETSKKRLAVLEANAERRDEEKARTAGRSREELIDALKGILTEEIPDSEDRRIRRQALLECCLGKIIVWDRTADNGDAPEYEIELIGPLVPDRFSGSGSPSTGGSSAAMPVSPLDSAAHLLETELRDREGGGSDAGGAAGGSENSSSQVATYKELFSRRAWRNSPEGRRSKRDAQLLEDPWPERRRRARGNLAPAWRSPRIPVGILPPRIRSAGETECRQALIDAAGSLPEGQRLTWNAYKRWYRLDPEERPPPWAIRRVATTLGMNFSEWRNQILPAARGHTRRLPDGYWTFERCKEAVARAVAEHAAASDSPLTERGYRKLCSWRSDLPSVKRLSKVARENETSIGQLLKGPDLSS